MKSQALKGMRDLLPAEQTLRDYIQGKILETYRASGFERISTPMLEDMENLDKSDGGDNLNLIFKVMKRGDKLTSALGSGDPKQLSDMGLRYDLGSRVAQNVQFFLLRALGDGTVLVDDLHNCTLLLQLHKNANKKCSIPRLQKG